MSTITVFVLFQALLANISAMYAVYHGPHGLREIGCKVHNAARLLALGNISLSFDRRPVQAMNLCVFISITRLVPFFV